MTHRSPCAPGSRSNPWGRADIGMSPVLARTIRDHSVRRDNRPTAACSSPAGTTAAFGHPCSPRTQRLTQELWQTESADASGRVLDIAELKQSHQALKGTCPPQHACACGCPLRPQQISCGPGKHLRTTARESAPQRPYRTSTRLELQAQAVAAVLVQRSVNGPKRSWHSSSCRPEAVCMASQALCT